MSEVVHPLRHDPDVCQDNEEDPDVLAVKPELPGERFLWQFFSELFHGAPHHAAALFHGRPVSCLDLPAWQ